VAKDARKLAESDGNQSETMTKMGQKHFLVQEENDESAKMTEADDETRRREEEKKKLRFEASKVRRVRQWK
jgi:hypothetical protein